MTEICKRRSFRNRYLFQSSFLIILRNKLLCCDSCESMNLLFLIGAFVICQFLLPNMVKSIPIFFQIWANINPEIWLDLLVFVLISIFHQVNCAKCSIAYLLYYVISKVRSVKRGRKVELLRELPIQLKSPLTLPLRLPHVPLPLFIFECISRNRKAFSGLTSYLLAAQSVFTNGQGGDHSMVHY